MYKFNWINLQVASYFYFTNQINFEIPASGCGIMSQLLRMPHCGKYIAYKNRNIKNKFGNGKESAPKFILTVIFSTTIQSQRKRGKLCL